MIHDLSLTRHAEARMRQRGIRNPDIELLIQLGERVADDALLLTRRRAAQEIARLRCRIQQIERLCGTRLIIAEGKVITVYHEFRPVSRGKRAKRNRRKQ